MPVRKLAIGRIGGVLVQVDVERTRSRPGSLTVCCQRCRSSREQPEAGVEVPPGMSHQASALRPITETWPVRFALGKD